jgi:hypothetical protein
MESSYFFYLSSDAHSKTNGVTKPDCGHDTIENGSKVGPGRDSCGGKPVRAYSKGTLTAWVHGWK